MPNLKSPKKELRKSAKRKVTNKRTLDSLKKIIKVNKEMIKAKDLSVKDKISGALKAIDKAVKKGIIKKNNGNRKKSRLQKRLNQILKK